MGRGAGLGGLSLAAVLRSALVLAVPFLLSVHSAWVKAPVSSFRLQLLKPTARCSQQPRRAAGPFPPRNSFGRSIHAQLHEDGPYKTATKVEATKRSINPQLHLQLHSGTDVSRPASHSHVALNSAPSQSEPEEDPGLLQAEETEKTIEKYMLTGLLGAAVLGAVGYCIYTGQSPDQVLASLTRLDPKQLLEDSVLRIEELGPLGYFYFAGIYVIAEMLAIPAVPLTASAGYLFGVGMGTAIVLMSATMAAGGAFLVGRTFLRQWVEKFIEKSKKFKSIDEAISRKGFQLVLLLRLSPLLPFAISNYLYGMTKVDFWQYLAGTLIGFTPGTLAFVLTGHVGRELSGIEGTSGDLPWYAYAAALGAVGVIGSMVSKIASQALAEVEAEQSAL